VRGVTDGLERTGLKLRGVLMKRFDTSYVGKKHWYCGCYDPNGERVHHSDACIKRYWQSLKAKGQGHYQKYKPVRRLTYFDRVNKLASTPSGYEHARQQRYIIDSGSPGVQESLELYFTY